MLLLPLSLLSTVVLSSALDPRIQSIIDRLQSAEQLKRLPVEHRSSITAESILSSLSDGRRLPLNGTLSKCEEDVLQMVFALQDKTNSSATFRDDVVYPALDSWGKTGAGVLRGHVIWMGLLSECKAIHHERSDGRHLSTDYFRFFVDPRIPRGTNDSCLPLLQLDACLPSSCTSSQLGDLFQAGNANSSVCAVAGVNDNVPPVVPGTFIVGGILLFFLLTSVASGIFDYLVGPEKMRRLTAENCLVRLFHAFSMYQNISEILRVNEKKDGQIGPLHCIRFFSMCWVMAGHIFLFSIFLSTNPLDLYDEIKPLWGGFFSNAYFAVDSFFFISGLLLSFLFFKAVKKNRRQALSPLSWAMMYVHRILRLSPPYYFIIIGYTFVFSTWLHDMPQFIMVHQAGDVWDSCRKNWWINLLYLQNFVEYETQCYLVSWYLATDLQIFLFTPLLLIPLAVKPLVGVAVSVGVFVASTVACFWEVKANFFPPNGMPIGDEDPRMGPLTQYTLLVYGAPWIRCQIYIMGMLVGWFLQRTPKLKMHWLLSAVLWTLSTALMLCVVLGLHEWNNGHILPLFWRAAYNSLSKVAWGLGLSWIVIACFYGHGGMVNASMSWSIFVPLGRLSYSAYLIHYICGIYYLGMGQSPLTHTNILSAVCMDLLPVIAITFLVAVVWSAVFEIPFGKVESMLIGGLRGKDEGDKREGEPLTEEGSSVSIVTVDNEVPPIEKWQLRF